MLPPNVHLGKVPYDAQANGVPAVAMEKVVFPDGSSGMRPSSTYEPRAWIWLNAKQAGDKSLAKVIDKEDDFCSRQYFYTPQGVMKPVLFKKK